MNTPHHALLLVGSPRGSKSTSESLGSYLLEKLHAGGFEAEKTYIQASMRSQEARAKMLEQVGDSDLLILAFPLYIDSLPAPLIAALESIAKYRKDAPSPKNQRLVTIVNNGFPEASQNDTALKICRQFALEAGIEWTGGLSLGGGGAIGGVPLEQAGFVGRNVRKALDFAAKDLLEGKAVSKQALDLMAKPIVPKWLFLLFANRGWKKQAKECGAQDRLYTKP